MAVSRRNLLKTSLAAGMAASMPSVLRAQTAPAAGRTVRMVMSFPTVFDPVVRTDQATTDYAAAIYDTLFSLDSKLTPQPQMVERWGLSDDKKTYTFELRDGLGWHDGTPVTAADCIASIRRWAQVSQGGQFMMSRVQEIATKDDKSFTIAFREPLSLVPDILARGYLFIMREKDADKPATEAVTAQIGSGPFTFNEALAKPGANFAYDRNEKYVPRKEPSDGLAGGKIVNVDRVIVENIGDPQTAIAALQAGEVDFYQTPPADLYSGVEGDSNLALEVLDKYGQDFIARMNCLQKPFDNVKARQAVLHLVDQEAFLRVVSPDPRYTKTITSLFGSGNPITNDENTGWFKKGGNPEKAKQLFKEAGYAGEKVVILQPTDWAEGSNTSQLLGDALRKIGVNAELAPSDWGGVAARRANKGPVDEGGWSIHITTFGDFGLGVPITSAILSANGEEGWYGWPKDDEYEALRAKWADVETEDERKTLAREMQRIAWDYVPQVMLGGVVAPIARRKTLTGLIGMPDVVPLWNMQKAPG
ncbi:MULTISPECIES: ABC transporter substrate-binding protein [unclassified Mesorhizobium]|uniref:ABC transporter substrate-binding protein n=1 Tax=unclassified Mesorhizobium TaxID=325217 RepID=UPI0033373DC6